MDNHLLLNRLDIIPSDGNLLGKGEDLRIRFKLAELGYYIPSCYSLRDSFPGNVEAVRWSLVEKCKRAPTTIELSSLSYVYGEIKSRDPEEWGDYKELLGQQIEGAYPLRAIPLSLGEEMYRVFCETILVSPLGIPAGMEEELLKFLEGE